MVVPGHLKGVVIMVLVIFAMKRYTLYPMGCHKEVVEKEKN
jgi:hypothetical protein